MRPLMLQYNATLSSTPSLAGPAGPCKRGTADRKKRRKQERAGRKANRKRK